MTIKTPRRRKWLRRLAWAAAITLTVLVAVRIVAGVWAWTEYRGRIEELKRAGVPLTLAEMAPGEVSDSENAAPSYVDAFAKMERLTVEQMERVAALGRSNEPLNADNVTEARALLAEASEAVAQLVAGAGRPKCRYDVDYRRGPLRMRLPHLQKIRAGVALLRLAAQTELVEGRADDAIAHTAAALKLARSVREEPMLVSMLIEESATSAALKELEIVLDRSEPSAEALRSAASALGEPMTRERLIRAIRAERCTGIETIRLVVSDPNRLVAVALGREPVWIARVGIRAGVFLVEPVFVADGCDYLDFLGRMETLAAPAHREGGAEWRLESERGERTAYGRALLHPISRVLTPALRRMMQGFDRGVTRSREARIALALRLYRLAHGEYPETLDALVGEVLDAIPRDPFSGRAFYYRREGAGFLLYSVGANARGESGVNADAPGKPDDVAWRCSR